MNKWNYDYSKILWMKMYLADPDFPNNRSNVYITFEQALEIIKTVDQLTQGTKKIIYLVGWQGLGHDDCYPEMDVVNEALKRPHDKTACDSLWWLYEEAKKYNTVVSFHVNVSDAYTATPCFPELAAANALVNNLEGKPTPIEIFNGRDGYKTSYKQFWESGLFKRVWDRFCEVTPVREAGTVHIDNFCIAESLNPQTYVEEQDAARNEMLDYIQSLGIDVTSEYTYREAHFRNESPTHPIRKLFATAGEDMTEVSWEDVPLRTLGRIPATWWTSNMSMRDCIDIPPALYSGHLNNPAQMKVFYGTMHGEDIWRKYGNLAEDWAPAFQQEFCTYHLPYVYLNRYQRLRFEEDPAAEKDERFTVFFSDGVVTRAKDLSITKNGVLLKQGNDVLLPLDETNEIFIAYSENGRSGEWNIPDAAFDKADVFEITPNGNLPRGSVAIKDGKVRLDVQPGTALALKAKK